MVSKDGIPKVGGGGQLVHGHTLHAVVKVTCKAAPLAG